MEGANRWVYSSETTVSRLQCLYVCQTLPLASDEADHATGLNLEVDGGRDI